MLQTPESYVRTGTMELERQPQRAHLQPSLCR
jgi:hypothetical protein